MSAKSRSEGEQALIEARRIESEQNRRLNEISKQIQNAKIMEEHIAQVHFLIVFHVYKWSAVIIEYVLSKQSAGGTVFTCLQSQNSDDNQ